MGLFSDTSFEEGRKLYYVDAKAGIEMMKKHAKTADEFNILQAKAWQANDSATEIFAATRKAEERGKRRFNW